MIKDWKDVNLEQFIELAKIEVDKELQKTPLKRAYARIAVLSEKSEEELLSLPGSEFGLLIKDVQFCDQEPVFDLPKTFDLGGVEYGFREEGELSAGEYISLETSIADALEKKTSAFPAILSILIRPVVRSHDPEFGDIVKVEPFDTKKHKPRIAKFMKELRVPFFIAALSDITTGEKGIKEVAKSYMTQGNTQRTAKK